LNRITSMRINNTRRTSISMPYIDPNETDKNSVIPKNEKLYMSDRSHSNTNASRLEALQHARTYALLKHPIKFKAIKLFPFSSSAGQNAFPLSPQTSRLRCFVGSCDTTVPLLLQ